MARQYIFLLILLTAGTATAQHELYPAAENIRQLIDSAGAAVSNPGADYIIILDRSETEVEDSGLSHVRRRTVTKVLTDRGALALAQARLDYAPGMNAIDARRIAVHRADGQLEQVNPTGLIDVVAPATGIYWGARMKIMALPRLEPGDAIEIETYKVGYQIAYLSGQPTNPPANSTAADEQQFIPPMRGHFYDVVLFQGAAPLIERTAIVRVPRSKPLQFDIYNGDVRSSLTFTDDELIYTFWKTNAPALVPEPRTPQTSDIAPKVIMATVSGWPERSRWFFNTNDWVFASNPEIDAKVAELTRGLTSDADIMAVLLHWVAQEIRYAGFSMGQGEGYTIHPGAMTFADRCGVCKDLAGMLVTMLRSAGYTCYAAMTMAGARVDEIPADQFNHCVVAVQNPDGSFIMLDPTWANFHPDIWSRAEGEQHYVIGSPEGEELEAIRSFAPRENLLTVTLHAKFSEDGTLRGTLRLSGRGQSDSILRKEIAFTDRNRLRFALERKTGLLAPDARLIQFKTGDPRDFNAAMYEELEFELPQYAVPIDGALLWQPCCLRILLEQQLLFRLGQLEPVEQRTWPIMNWYSQLVELEEVYTLPKGFTLTSPTRSWASGKDIVSVTLSLSGERRQAVFNGTIVLDGRTLPATAWPELRDGVKRLREASGTWFSAGRATEAGK